MIDISNSFVGVFIVKRVDFRDDVTKFQIRYSFWVGATLKMLDAFDFVDTKACCAFHKTCEFRFGGFCKFPESRYPDPLHAISSNCP